MDYKVGISLFILAAAINLVAWLYAKKSAEKIVKYYNTRSDGSEIIVSGKKLIFTGDNNNVRAK